MNMNLASIIDDSESNADPDKEAHSTLQTFDEHNSDAEAARKAATLESAGDPQNGKIEYQPKEGKYMRYETRA